MVDINAKEKSLEEGKVASTLTDTVNATSESLSSDSHANALMVTINQTEFPESQQGDSNSNIASVVPNATNDEAANENVMMLPAAVTDPVSTNTITAPAGGEAPPAVQPRAAEDLPLILCSLSIDSLHCIASFLATVDWSKFGQANHATNRVCNQVFRRVRMHGFRCATEVISAWVSNAA